LLVINSLTPSLSQIVPGLLIGLRPFISVRHGQLYPLIYENNGTASDAVMVSNTTKMEKIINFFI